MSTRCLISHLLIGILLLVQPLIAQTDGDKQAQAGFDALRKGDAKGAAVAFESALSKNPRDPLLHFGAGAAAHRLGRLGDAADSLTRALELNPKLIPAVMLLGEIEYLQGRLNDAIQRYEEALPVAGSVAPAIEKWLSEWRKEAAVHRNLTTANNARFSVVFDGRSDNSLAAHTAGVLERAFWRIGENIGAYPPNRILVTLYTEQQFRDITRAPAWSSGVFDGKVRIPVKGVAEDREQFDRLLVHELTHAIIYGLAPQGVPAWLHEGLASYFEPADVTLAQQRVLARGVVIPFAELRGSFRRLDSARAAVAYDQSLVAVDLLARSIGTRMAALLRALGRGESFSEAMGRVGLRASEFEEQVLRRLRP